MRVTGVDGCAGGWVAVTVADDSADLSWRWVPLGDVGALLVDAEVDAVAIDIPIGLPEWGRRACDVQARAALRGRASSVFAAPIRPVLDCPTYGDARALLASMGGPSMSAQSFGIVPAVRAVDAVMTPELERRVVEVHPELTFDCLGGGRRLPPKRDPAGELARQALLREWRCDLVDSVPSRLSGIGIPMDDALDALACAWTAGRWAAGTAEVLGEGTRDTRGLRARIVV